jgi:hypothetical protein
MRRALITSALFGLAIIAVSQRIAPLQSQPPGPCPTLVRDALAQIETTCANLTPNSACYGYNRVGALFNEAALADQIAFSTPADRAELGVFQSIETAPLDEALGVWGVALLSVRANIPDTLPGQSVTFLLMGDARLDNEVTPEEAARTPPLAVTTTARANLRSQPDARASVVDIVPEATTLMADIASPDGAWARVTLPDPQNPALGRVAWLSREVLAADPAIDSLARPDLARMSPMQAFRFSTGIGMTTCAEAQGALLVQGPNNIVVDLTANGAHIKVASTVLLRTTPDQSLRLTTLSGAAAVDGYAVPQGYTVEAPLDETGAVSGAFTPPVRIDEAELSYIQTFEALPVENLNYEIELPDDLDDIEEYDPEDLQFDDAGDGDSFDVEAFDAFIAISEEVTADQYEDRGDANDVGDAGGDDGGDGSDTGDDSGDGSDTGDDGGDGSDTGGDTGGDGGGDTGGDGSGDTDGDGSDTGGDGSGDNGGDGSGDTGGDGSDTGDDGGDTGGDPGDTGDPVEEEVGETGF